MSFAREKDTAVIIPARNEAERIATCLTALAPQCGPRVRVFLVVNNTYDDTAERARERATELGLDLAILTCRFAPRLGVGEARRRGAALALQQMPNLHYLLTTDADCAVAPDWIDRNLAHLTSADAVCGKVELLAEEAEWLAAIDPGLHIAEEAYRALVLEVFARHGPNGAGLRGTHGQTPGASLGFTRDGYLAAGGFAPIPCGEDRQIIRALRETSRIVRHASDVRVAASCRLTGRAAGGMADTLRARLSGLPCRADDCLPAARKLIKEVRAGTLGSWPPQIAPEDCVPMENLAAESARLRAFISSTRTESSGAFASRAPTGAPGCPVPQTALAAFRDER